jgi:DNA-directed RNA polymerase subunit RPC12/RpoP
MKFVCMKCEAFMLFQKVEKPADESLGVMFECPQCGSRFAMVTNPGETQLVNALGVKIGGRTTAPEPFELTRGTLKESVAPQLQASATTASGGSCPFSSMVAGMQGGETKTPLSWSSEALDRMEKIPDFVRPMVKSGIEAYARKKGYQVVTPTVIDESKNDNGGLKWTPEAERRLENIPSFIRPMAKMEIERLAREQGSDTVTEALMEESKGKFGQYMSM